jgi:hypothetical protein
LEHLMSGFDTPRLQLSGLGERQTEDTANSWRRLGAAMLMAAAALFLCAVIVVILAPLLSHPATAWHAADLNLSPMVSHARV